MLSYLKYLPRLSIIAKHPVLVQALSDSLPDVQKISDRFTPHVAELQQMVAEIVTMLKQIEGTP